MKKILVMGVALFLLHSIVRTAGQQASPTSLTALQKKGAAAAVLRGTITDDAGRAVAAALVQWTHGSESDTGLTDEDGKYAFAIPCHCGISPGGGGAAAFTVSLSVRANPYSPAGKSVQAASGQTANVDFRLVRKPGSQIGIVQGRITDSASGDGVAGAKVAITNAGGELTATTNADGNYTIAGVDFGSGLEIEVSTEVPPCLAPAVASDGGVASAGSLIAGGKPAFKSSYNRTLFNLQIYQAGASSQTNGLAAVALQDNGAVYGKLPGGWQHLTNCGCDGGGAKFLAASTSGGPGYDFLVLAEWGAPSWPWNWVASHSGNNPVYPFNSQQTIPLGSNTAGIASGPGVFFPAFPLAVVRSPHFAGTTRRLMYAVTAQGSTVYGTLAGTDGSNPSFQALGKVGKGQKVTALASDDGQEVLIGTDHGHIYQLTAPYTGATAIQMAMTAPGTGKGSIGGLMDAANVGYAIYNDSNSNGYVLLQQETWDQVGVGSLPSNLPFNAIEETDDVTRLFVASAASVYSSSTYGFKWMAAANGLPTIAKGNDLQVVTQPDGKKYVYLGTYGWSLWRARLP